MTRQVKYILAVGLLLSVVFPSLAREWTDSTGRFSVDADFVEIRGDKVVLRKSTGSLITRRVAGGLPASSA